MAATTVPVGMPAIDFLRAYTCGWKLDAYLQLAYLDPEVDTSTPKALTVRFGDADAFGRLGDFIVEHDGKKNLYYCVSMLERPIGKKAEERHVVAACSLYVDCDPQEGEDHDATVARVLEKVAAFPLPPTLIVDSGGGVQVVWLLREPVILPRRSKTNTKPKLIGKALAKLFGGDAVQSLEHLMRLPGTWNIPTPTKLAKGRVKTPAKVLRYDENARYALEQFEALRKPNGEPLLPAVDPDAAPAAPKKLEYATNERDLLSRWQTAVNADADLAKVACGEAPSWVTEQTTPEEYDRLLARRLAEHDFLDDEIASLMGGLLSARVQMENLEGEARDEYLLPVIRSLYRPLGGSGDAGGAAPFDLAAVNEAALVKRLQMVRIDPELAALLRREPVKWMGGVTRSHFDWALALKLARFNFRDDEIAYILMHYSEKAAERSDPERYVGEIVAKVRKGVRHE